MQYLPLTFLLYIQRCQDKLTKILDESGDSRFQDTGKKSIEISQNGATWVVFLLFFFFEKKKKIYTCRITVISSLESEFLKR